MDVSRILLAGMPRLMSDIVAFGLAAHPDVEIVGVLDSVDALGATAHEARPDVLVLGTDGTALPAECGPVLAERPELRIVGIETDRVEAGLYELRPRRTALGVLTPDELAATIRAAAAKPVRLWEMG